MRAVTAIQAGKVETTFYVSEQQYEKFQERHQNDFQEISRDQSGVAFASEELSKWSRPDGPKPLKDKERERGS